MFKAQAPDFVPVGFASFADTPYLALPLRPQQREMWVESQMGAEASSTSNQCFILHLGGPLSVASMQNALDRVVGRHAALRTEATAKTAHPRRLRLFAATMEGR
jgi:hypothetical protein